MSQQNIPKSSSTPMELPVKRKRGRPRKDENARKKEKPQTPATPTSVGVSNIQPVKVNPSTSKIDNNLVGQVVSGVIEGTFDAGYFLSIRAGQSNTLLRGVVFHPGLYNPITPANDVAPGVKMYTRAELPVPVCNPINEATYQNASVTAQQALPMQMQHIRQAVVAPPMAPQHQALPVEVQNYQTAPVTSPQVVAMFKNGSVLPVEGRVRPHENLRMVEQDEVMQVFEVSKLLDEPKFDSLPGNETGNLGTQVQNHPVRSEIRSSDSVNNIEPNCPNQQIPLVALPQAPVPESQLVGSNNDLITSPNLGAHPDSIVPKSQSLESGLNPSGFGHNKPNCPNLRPNKTIFDDKPQSVEDGPKLNEVVHHEQENGNEPMDIVTENPFSSENEVQSESEVLKKDETPYDKQPVTNAELRTVEESISIPEQQAESIVLPPADQTASADFALEEGIRATPSHCSPTDNSGSENK